MLDGMGRDEMRASDADRERVVDRLRTALQEGRLELHEFDERLQGAYAAKTYGDLDALLTDLPVAALPMPVAEPAAPRPTTGEWIVHEWKGVVPTAVMLSVIWAIGGFGFFWPLWVIVPWAAFTLWHTISGLMSGEPRRWAERREAEARKEQELEARKEERKRIEAERIARGIPSVKKKKGDMSGSSEPDTPDRG